MLHLITSIIWAAPSAMAKGQLYSPEEGLNKYSLLIWYSRLEHVHHTTTSADPDSVHNTISLLSIPEEGLNKYSFLIWYSRLEHVHHTTTSADPDNVHNTISLLSIPEEGLNKYSFLIWYKLAGTYMYTMQQHQSTPTTYTIADIHSLYTRGDVGSNKYSLLRSYS